MTSWLSLVNSSLLVLVFGKPASLVSRQVVAREVRILLVLVAARHRYTLRLFHSILGRILITMLVLRISINGTIELLMALTISLIILRPIIWHRTFAVGITIFMVCKALSSVILSVGLLVLRSIVKLHLFVGLGIMIRLFLL